MLKLPQELVDLVLDNVDKNTLLACSLLSRAFRNVASPLLFRSLVIKDSSPTNHIHAFLRDLRTNTIRSSRLVKDLCLQGADSADDDAVVSIIDVYVIFSILDKLPSVHTLHLVDILVKRHYDMRDVPLKPRSLKKLYLQGLAFDLNSRASFASEDTGVLSSFLQMLDSLEYVENFICDNLVTVDVDQVGWDWEEDIDFAVSTASFLGRLVTSNFRIKHLVTRKLSLEHDCYLEVLRTSGALDQLQTMWISDTYTTIDSILCGGAVHNLSQLHLVIDYDGGHFQRDMKLNLTQCSRLRSLRVSSIIRARATGKADDVFRFAAALDAACVQPPDTVTSIEIEQHHKTGTFNHDKHVLGHWLPRNHQDLKPYIDSRLEKARHRKAPGYKNDVIRQFRELIEHDADIYMGFTQMFAALPADAPVKDYETMLTLFDVAISEAPAFVESTVVAIPITAILLGPMGTLAGFNMFGNDRVNKMIKAMLQVWHNYLNTEDSRSVLTDDVTGWFGPNASEAIPNFAQTYVCEPDQPYHGYKSWDDFFTRLFRDGIRPIDFPDRTDFITSPCEVTAFRYQPNVKAREQFWIKGHPYSTLQMLNNDPLAEHFVGGTVWQAFLSALNYHRWHAPVTGKVVKTVLVPGTYYLQAIDALEVNQVHTPGAVKEGEAPGPAPDLLDRSQDFITQLATRGLIFIEADNPKIGLVCFIAVGMVEVSTCDIKVKAGQRVQQGDELGMFHFGGSTSCMMFNKHAKITLADSAQPANHVNLNSVIAQVN
ncbi:hypothetical protein EIP91_000624 [Steccherinum ochraceum]|uniref:F-box domain-containing protein n=1 Tax=Steccherinum ochraceum TaxID=92696 RepID=A0A4R0RIX6_9APHY|nr:hypothetical protein EIP91_000624 [Steccherinum ochraceum]